MKEEVILNLLYQYKPSAKDFIDFKIEGEGVLIGTDNDNTQDKNDKNKHKESGSNHMLHICFAVFWNSLGTVQFGNHTQDC